MVTNRAPRRALVKLKTAQCACLLPVNGRFDRSKARRELQPTSRERSDLFGSGVRLRASDFIGVNRSMKRGRSFVPQGLRDHDLTREQNMRGHGVPTLPG